MKIGQKFETEITRRAIITDTNAVPILPFSIEPYVPRLILSRGVGDAAYWTPNLQFLEDHLVEEPTDHGYDATKDFNRDGRAAAWTAKIAAVTPAISSLRFMVLFTKHFKRYRDSSFPYLLGDVSYTIADIRRWVAAYYSVTAQLNTAADSTLLLGDFSFEDDGLSSSLTGIEISRAFTYYQTGPTQTAPLGNGFITPGALGALTDTQATQMAGGTITTMIVFQDKDDRTTEIDYPGTSHAAPYQIVGRADDVVFSGLGGVYKTTFLVEAAAVEPRQSTGRRMQSFIITNPDDSSSVASFALVPTADKTGEVITGTVSRVAYQHYRALDGLWHLRDQEWGLRRSELTKDGNFRVTLERDI